MKRDMPDKPLVLADVKKCITTIGYTLFPVLGECQSKAINV